MLTSIHLTNFKKHTDLHLDFKAGVNVILGANYSGKSSILEAVMFAFFGPTAVVGGGAVVANTDGGKESVTLNFEADGCDWILERTHNSARLTADDGREASGKEAVNGLVESILGSSKKIFSILKYSRQEETSGLLRDGDLKLTQMLEELSGVDVVDVVLEELKTYRTTVNVGVAVLEASLQETNPIEMGESLTELNKKLLSSTGLASAVRQAIEGLSTEKADASSKLATLQLAQRTESLQDMNRASLTERISTMEQQRNSLSDELSGMELKPYEAELEELRQDEENFNDYLNNISALKKVKASLSSFETTLTSCASVRDSLVVKKRELTELLETYRTPEDLRISEEKFKATQDKMVKLAEIVASGECPHCHRPFEDATGVDEAQTELALATENLPILGRNLDTIKAEVSNRRGVDGSLSACAAELQRLELRVENTTFQKSIAKKGLAETEEAMQALTDLGMEESLGERLSETRKELSLLQQAHVRKAELETDLRNALRGLTEVEEELNNIPHPAPVSTEELNDCEAVVNKADTDLVVKRENLSEIEMGIGELTSDIKNTEKSLEIAEGKFKTLEQDKAKQDKANRLTKFLRENRITLMENIWSSVLAQTSVIAGMITGGAIERVYRDSTSGICYVEDGRVHPVVAGSGCQKAVIGVAIRSAIARTFQNDMKFIMLDEITANMDEEHASATMAVIQELNDQVIYITHRSADLRETYHTTDL